ncbi:hypothetical protein BT69DRAFT_36941 [Atractiella rhizophila]|nr:hypothetical protein BT69DRAFT_36941 [Atractiella rhizophila]
MAIREEKLVTSTKRVQALLATFDDPNTSDLAFIFPAPEGQDGKGMKIYAAKKQLMACSTYFKEMFDPLPTNRLPASEPEAAEEQKDDTPEAEMETPAEPTSDQPAEVDATTKEEIELDDGEAADAQPATPTPTPPSAVPMAPYCIDTLHQDSDNEIDERYRSQYKPRPYRAHIRKIVIKDANYSTYKALLFWLLSGLIEFAPLRSRERAKIFKSTSEDPGANFASVRNIFKNAIEKDEHGLEWTTCPLPCSPKSIYRVATAYGIQDLKTIALDHLLNSLTPQNVTFEIFSPFSARFEAVKEMEIDYLIANWGRVSRSRAWIALLDPKTIQTPQDMATLHQVISRTMARNVPEYKKLEVEDSDEETEDGGDQTQEEEATGAED